MLDISTLHLIDANSPQARPVTLALLRATAAAEADSHVLLLGPPALGRAATSARLEGAQRIGVPRGRAELGIAVLRRVLRALGEPAVICAWSAGALRAARWLRPRTPCVACLTQQPDRAMIRAVSSSWRGRWASGARLAAAAVDPVIAAPLQPHVATFVQRPRDGEVHESGGAIALPPPGVGVQVQTGDPERARWRDALRARWGSDRIDPREHVVALLSDPPEAADAQTALLLIGLIRETLAVHAGTPPGLAVLVHPAQRHRHRAEEVLMHVKTPVRVIQDADLAAPWRVLPGCDAAVSAADARGGLALAAGLAAGVPCVAPDSPRHRLLLSHGETGLLAPRAEPRHLAAALQRMIEDPAHAAALGAAGRRAIERGDGEAQWLDAVERAKRMATGAADPAGDAGAAAHGTAGPRAAGAP